MVELNIRLLIIFSLSLAAAGFLLSQVLFGLWISWITATAVLIGASTVFAAIKFNNNFLAAIPLYILFALPLPLSLHIGLVREPDGSRTSLAFFRAFALKKCFLKLKLFGN